MKGGNEALHPYIHLSSDCSKNDDRPFFFYDLGPFKGRAEEESCIQCHMWKRYTFLPAAATTKVVALLFHLFCTLLIRGKKRGKDWSICIKCMLLKNPHSTPFLYLGSSCCITDLGLKLHKKYKIIQRIIWHILTGFGWTLRVLRGWDANWRTFLKGFHIFCNVKSFVKLQRNYYLLVIKTGLLK